MLHKYVIISENVWNISLLTNVLDLFRSGCFWHFFSVKKSQTLLWVSERIAISASRKIKSSFWTQNISLFPYELLPRLILTLLYIVTFWDELISEVLFLWVQITDCKLLKKSENMKIWKPLMNWWNVKLFQLRFSDFSISLY